MSEQPDRCERWVNVYPRGRSLPHTSREVAEKTLVADGKTVRRVDLFDGETIVGPLEMAVIEAAIKLNWLNAKHDAMNAKVLGAKTPSEVSDAIEDRHALMKMRPKIEAEFADSLRALREARKLKETNTCVDSAAPSRTGD